MHGMSSGLKETEQVSICTTAHKTFPLRLYLCYSWSVTSLTNLTPRQALAEIHVRFLINQLY